jgi:N-acetylmuramoyl-L-alanine amidase
MKYTPSRSIVIACAAVLMAAAPGATFAQTARERYTALQARETNILATIAATAADAPAGTRDEVVRQARSVIAGYDALVRRFHSSGYSDNALFNAAAIADALYAKFHRGSDRTLAERYRHRLKVEYPTSSLLKRMAATDRVAASKAAPPVASPVGQPVAAPAVRPAAAAMLTAIDRAVMPEAVRITLTLDREVTYREERLSGPARVFFDLKEVQPSAELKDAVLRFPTDAVRQIRVGRHPDNTVRVVLDLEDVTKYSVFTLYNPFRLVIDCENATGPARAAVAPSVPPPPAPAPLPVPVPAAAAVTVADPITAPVTSPVLAVKMEPPLPPPAAPSKNGAGGFSLSRQLGLGITRVVLDPGHGGHDPGAMGRGLNEADLTLDVALRLETLLLAEGLEVVLTRRTDVYVPLEERTAIANRESADLFLSIHANASRNAAAQGVETYFLSFASSPDAEAVAARENSASSGGMHNLPDIVKAITLNNKLDESKDFAAMVQEALVSRLRRSNKNLRNLGVKKAPFVVLIGAGMPSVLAEISFLTNKQDLALLKTNTYKQRIAEALHASVMRYRRSLKGQSVAER